MTAPNAMPVKAELVAIGFGNNPHTLHQSAGMLKAVADAETDEILGGSRHRLPPVDNR